MFMEFIGQEFTKSTWDTFPLSALMSEIIWRRLPSHMWLWMAAVSEDLSWVAGQNTSLKPSQ